MIPTLDTLDNELPTLAMQDQRPTKVNILSSDMFQSQCFKKGLPVLLNCHALQINCHVLDLMMSWIYLDAYAAHDRQ